MGAFDLHWSRHDSIERIGFLEQPQRAIERIHPLSGRIEQAHPLVADSNQDPGSVGINFQNAFCVLVSTVGDDQFTRTGVGSTKVFAAVTVGYFHVRYSGSRRIEGRVDAPLGFAVARSADAGGIDQPHLEWKPIRGWLDGLG